MIGAILYQNAFNNGIYTAAAHQMWFTPVWNEDRSYKREPDGSLSKISLGQALRAVLFSAGFHNGINALLHDDKNTFDDSMAFCDSLPTIPNSEAAK